VPLSANERVLQALQAAGLSPDQANAVLGVVLSTGISLQERPVNQEMSCRWVPTDERPVPPDADTIIRTITTTRNGLSVSETFWLDGLQPPVLRY